MSAALHTQFLLVVHTCLQVLFVGRALLRPHREPASRLAWVVVIIVAPIFGMVAYVLFGETSIGRRRIARRGSGLCGSGPSRGQHDCCEEGAVGTDALDHHGPKIGIDNRAVKGRDLSTKRNRPRTPSAGRKTIKFERVRPCAISPDAP